MSEPKRLHDYPSTPGTETNPPTESATVSILPIHMPDHPASSIFEFYLQDGDAVLLVLTPVGLAALCAAVLDLEAARAAFDLGQHRIAMQANIAQRLVRGFICSTPRALLSSWACSVTCLFLSPHADFSVDGTRNMFVEAGRSFARCLIDESFLDKRECTLRPDPAFWGVAGGLKYRFGNQLFKVRLVS